MSPHAKIYLGSPEIIETITADLEAKSIADYVPVYDRLVRAIHTGENITIAVTDPTVGAWLERLAAPERYGSNRIQVEKLTRRSRLQELWRITVPDWVGEDQIAQAELLNVKIAAQPGRDFEDFVLETFFSSFLTQPRLPLPRLVDLLKSYEPEQWQEATQRPLVGDIFRRRLQRWNQQAESPGEQFIIQGLQQSPEHLIKELATFKALANYSPEVGQRVMGDTFEALARLELDLSQVNITETQLGPALDQIRVHLEELIRTESPKAGLEAILEQASGCLEIEFDAVQRLLRSGEVDVDQDLVRRVRGLFTPIQDRPQLDQALADLDLLISQPPPPPPDPDPANPWSEAQWLTWAEQHYLPYRFWLEEIGELTGDVVDFADAYAEWLYQNYPAMRLNSKRMIYQALPTLKSRMMGPGPVLVLVIDNLNAKFLQDFTRYMQTQGYYNEQLAYYISMLPSCTEISKKCLMTGQPEPFDGTAYEKPIQTVWSQQLPGKQVLYLPHVGALRTVKKRQHDVYFLNYLPLDMAFHQDEEQIGISHAQAARSYLRALASDVRAFGERLGAARDLVVILISDHGSTRIPAEAANLIDQTFFAKRVNDKHHRYVSISDNELAQLSDNIKYQCYIFERDRFGLSQNNLAAKRYYRFLPTTESIYIHGGLTPEETLVPVAVFTPQTVSPKPLTIRLLENQFYYERKSEIRLEVVNANTYPCENVRIEIQNPSVQASASELGALAAMTQIQVTLEARFRRSHGTIETLRVRTTYTFLEQPQQQDNELEVEMKSMMQQAFDLDELF